MEQIKPLQYLLRNGLLVALNDDMALSFVTIERAIMSFYGFSEELDAENGVAIWRDVKTGQRRFISSRSEGVTDDGLQALAGSWECPILDIMNDASIAQDLIKDLGLLVTPVTFREGSLVGTWRVERISHYMPWDQAMNGIITGVNQPVATESANLIHAVCATACRVMGLGKMAFVHFPQGAEGEANIIASDFSMLGQFQNEVGVTVFRSEMLDKYITSSLPDEVKMEAIASARAECRSVIAAVEQETQTENVDADESQDDKKNEQPEKAAE